MLGLHLRASAGLTTAAIVTALGGCVSTSQGVALGGAVSTAAGTMLLASTGATGSTDDNEMDPTPAGAVFLLGGLVVLFSAAAMEERQTEVPPVVITIADRSRVEIVARAQAWQLTKAAYLAARRDDCAKVTQLSRRIRDLDSDMHTSVFLRDVAVRRCALPSAYDGPAPGSEPGGAPRDELPPQTEKLPLPSEVVPELPPFR